MENSVVSVIDDPRPVQNKDIQIRNISTLNSWKKHLSTLPLTFKSSTGKPPPAPQRDGTLF